MKKIIFLLTFLLEIVIAFAEPLGIAPVNDPLKVKNKEVVVLIQDGYERSLLHQQKELTELLVWNRYAIAIAKLYGIFLATILILVAYRSFPRHHITQFIHDASARINEAIFLSIGKAIRYSHFYRALSSFFMV